MNDNVTACWNLCHHASLGSSITPNDPGANMAADRMTIDDESIFDNIDANLVEFTAEIDDEDYEFAVQYDVLEALSGDRPDGDAQEMFTRFSDTIGEAGLVALRRNADRKLIVISENDLEEAI